MQTTGGFIKGVLTSYTFHKNQFGMSKSPEGGFFYNANFKKMKSCKYSDLGHLHFGGAYSLAVYNASVCLQVEQKDKASSDISTNEACASSAPTRSSVSAITVSRPKNTWKPSLTFDPSLTNRSLSGDIGYYTGGSNITGDSQGYASSHYSGKGFSSERSVAAVPPHIQRQMSMRQAGVEMEFQDWGIMELSSGQTDL